MLHRLSPVAAMVAATGVARAAQPTLLPIKTDLISIYRGAADNNANLTVTQADYLACKWVMPQAHADLLPQFGAGTRVGDTRIAFDECLATVRRNSQVVRATLSQPLFHAGR